jgi:hypothetical protein
VHPVPVKLGSTLSLRYFETYRHLPPGHKSESEARESYRLFVADPASVKFKAIKRLADGNQLCSARVTRDCRVLGVLANDIVIWFWIGSHDNYERLIRELR